MQLCASGSGCLAQPCGVFAEAMQLGGEPHDNFDRALAIDAAAKTSSPNQMKRPAIAAAQCRHDQLLDVLRHQGAALVLVEHGEVGIEPRFERIFAQDSYAEGV